MIPKKDKHRHCGYCGTAYEAESWPRVCGCGETTWRNPTPVAVLIVPVRSGGVLLIRRNNDQRETLPTRSTGVAGSGEHRLSIRPAGRLALPGGFIDFGETWQAAAAREAHEEAGITIEVETIRHLRTVSPPDGSVVLIFGAAAPIDGIGDDWVANAEVTERRVVDKAVELAFPTHTDVLRAWFAGER